MLDSVPIFVSIVFVLTTMLTIYLCLLILRNANPRSPRISWILSGVIFWLGLQTILTLNDVYINTIHRVPPPFLLAILPAFFIMFLLFLAPRGKRFVDSLPLLELTQLSFVRIPVELVLYWLFVYKAIPELMTFSGRNFDILAGITAPFVAYFGIKRGLMGQRGLLIWNIAGLLLLLFIIVNALLSAPSGLQRFAFDQPNIGLLHFPFVWLAAFVAPVVLLSHLISIRKLLRE